MQTELNKMSLTNQLLIEKTVKLVTEERRIGVEVIEHLCEIERRKAYTDLKYDSLFTFCLKELHYSEPQTSLRLQAMRALSEHPDLKEKIQIGTMTVSTVAQVQTHIKKQTLAGDTPSLQEKKELFEAIENKSAKEVKREIYKWEGRDELITLILNLTPELKSEWDQVKNLSAHATRGQDTEILKMLLREWLDRHDPIRKDRLKQERKKTSSQKDQNSDSTAVSNSVSVSDSELVSSSACISNSESIFNSEPCSNPMPCNSAIDSCVAHEIEIGPTLPDPMSTTKTSNSLHDGANPISLIHSTNTGVTQNIGEALQQRRRIKVKSRSIPAQNKKWIWKRDEGKCTECGSGFAVQFEHIKPFAKGGNHSIENLKLLCRSCNIHAGIKEFGIQKIRGQPKNP